MSNKMLTVIVAGFVMLGLAAGLSRAAVEPKTGTFTGLVVEKAKDGTAVVLKADNGQRVPFRVKWIGGAPKDGGHVDKDMVAAINKLRNGDRVEVQWVATEEGKRINALKVLSATSEPAQTQPAQKEGTLTGVITAKTETSITVKPATGESISFTPRMVNGKPDATILNVIRERNVGDKVEVRWVFHEHYRAVAIKLLEKARAVEPRR